jgi:hypothetical protein
MTAQQLFDSNDEVRAFAEQIHEAGRGCGPVCESCILKAIRRLGIDLSEDIPARENSRHY